MTIKREDIYNILKNILVEDCGIDESLISEKSELINDLHLDSIKQLTFLTEIENKFLVNLGEDPENPPRNILDVIELLLKLNLTLDDK